MNKPEVSVIIPVYNGENFISRSVCSALNQTSVFLEVIVVNDGSTDSTISQIKNLSTDSRLKIISQSNQGAAVARNKGISVSTGGLLAFLDADDFWFPTYLETACMTLGNNIGFTYGGYYEVNDTKKLVRIPPLRTYDNDILQFVIQQEGLLIPSVLLMHRKVFFDHGPFSPSLKYHEDRSFFIKVAAKYPAFPTGQRLTIVRHSLAGKGRRTTRSFSDAINAQEILTDSLHGYLSAYQIDDLTKNWKKNLFCRFAMNGFLAHAKKMYRHIDHKKEMYDSPRSVLSLISVVSGVNILYGCRCIVRFFTMYILFFWWKRVSRDAYAICNSID